MNERIPPRCMPVLQSKRGSSCLIGRVLACLGLLSSRRRHTIHGVFGAMAANAALLILAAPLFAQLEGLHEPEVYAIAGYSRIEDTTGLCFFCFSGSALQKNHAQGGYFGVGVGARITSISREDDESLWCMQGEFFQSRASRSIQQPYMNTGALNFALEKRTGKVRPGAIVLGIGGAQGNGGGHLFLQAGGGAAVMLNERWFIRPQIRLQYWTQLFSTSRPALSAGIAIGYRF